MWCAPYAYKRRAGLGCGGADKWGIVPPEHAFPVADWSEGTGSVYCRGGSYCPTTLRSVPCPARHFCRQGTTEPEACPPGAVCPPGTEIFDDNFTGAPAGNQRGRPIVFALAQPPAGSVFGPQKCSPWARAHAYGPRRG